MTIRTKSVAVAARMIVLVIGATPIVAQQSTTEATTATFEVASVKPNKSGSRSSGSSTQPGGRYTATNVPLRLLIQEAFHLQDFQIVEAPGWMTSDRFDIAAKAEADSSGEQVRLMLQSLLAERFKLAVHRETREQPVYLMALARPDAKIGPGLRHSEIDCAGGRGRAAAAPSPKNAGPFPCGTHISNGTLQARSVRLQRFVETLSSVVTRIVQDHTGLTGEFDIDLDWSPDQTADATRPSIFTALQEQLGLKLDSARGPVEVLVVDRVEQPTPN